MKAMEENSFTDYYKVLQSERTASADELKKNYQRLVLSSHPDKSNTCDDKFHLIQKAWSILRNPETRILYDATLTCHEHNDHLLYETISISDMVHDKMKNIFTYNCRCGGVYLLDAHDDIPNVVVIECEECSFSIQVNR